MTEISNFLNGAMRLHPAEINTLVFINGVSNSHTSTTLGHDTASEVIVARHNMHLLISDFHYVAYYAVPPHDDLADHNLAYDFVQHFLPDVAFGRLLVSHMENGQRKQDTATTWVLARDAGTLDEFKFQYGGKCTADLVD